tara:strand:+ start:1613 stop:2011 length:399 start_codon:yes stop_codon:yes gene_type:complete
MKNKHNELVGSSIERTDDRIDFTGEVFTPIELCEKLVNEISEEILKNPKSTFLDDSAGNGNFMVALQTKLQQYHSLQHINDNMLYAIELMKDNHGEMCERLGVSVDHPHFLCKNSLKYDYSFGDPVGVEAFM